MGNLGRSIGYFWDLGRGGGKRGRKEEKKEGREERREEGKEGEERKETGSGEREGN